MSWHVRQSLLSGYAVALLSVCLMLAASSQPEAQQQRQQQARPPAPPAAVTAPEPPPVAYEPDLLRLAEIMGSLAFLRQLCTGPDAQRWRTRMLDLLEVEGTSTGRKERLAGAYNRGFSSYALTYRNCTGSAQEATARLSDDGDKLSRRISGRFGG